MGDDTRRHMCATHLDVYYGSLLSSMRVLFWVSHVRFLANMGKILDDAVDSGGIEVIIQNERDKTAPRCPHGMRSIVLLVSCQFSYSKMSLIPYVIIDTCFSQDQLCCSRKLAVERRKEGDFTRVLLVGTEKTATYFSGQTKRLTGTNIVFIIVPVLM